MALLLGLIGSACSGGDDAGSSPPTTERPPFVLVALGDSYSAGEGAPPYDAEPETCHRSPESWTRRLDVDSTDVASIRQLACSGAHIGHVVDGWPSRGLRAQVPAEPDPTVTLVTITIGGNDIGFGDIVAACFVFRCPKPDSEGFLASLDALRTALEDQLWPALSAAYPNALLVQVGYPRITPAEGTEPQDCFWLSSGDQTAAAGIVDALDDLVWEVAEDHGAQYVDVADVLEGHEMCTAEPWVNGISLGADAGNAHPNAAGQAAIEAEVARQLGIDLTPTLSAG